MQIIMLVQIVLMLIARLIHDTDADTDIDIEAIIPV